MRYKRKLGDKGFIGQKIGEKQSATEEGLWPSALTRELKTIGQPFQQLQKKRDFSTARNMPLEKCRRASSPKCTKRRSVLLGLKSHSQVLVPRNQPNILHISSPPSHYPDKRGERRPKGYNKNVQNRQNDQRPSQQQKSIAANPNVLARFRQNDQNGQAPAELQKGESRAALSEVDAHPVLILEWAIFREAYSWFQWSSLKVGSRHFNSCACK